MHAPSTWTDLISTPAQGDHIVQLYQDHAFLTEAVVRYVATGLRRDEAAIIIARPEHRAAFEAAGLQESAGLVMLDAVQTLGRFMSEGLPQWRPFHQLIGGRIAELRLQYRAVRAYGEMVDVLWQGGERDAALRLEEYWNELGRLQTFSLLCAYRMDNLDGAAYGGPLECVCRLHSHLIPARDYQRFNEAVALASNQVLEPSLAQIVLSLCAAQPPATRMPSGQAALLWLSVNMPRTARKVIEQARARYTQGA